MPNYIFKKERFYPIEKGIIKNTNENKRYVLPISITKNFNAKESWLIILKNPSKAGLTNIEESDCTVNRVGEYFLRNKKEVKEIVIMNLFANYEPDSNKLKNFNDKLIDSKNKEYLKSEILKTDNIILAWGEHPLKEFKEMKIFVLSLLKDKNVYQMKHPKYGINHNRPLHGQVWGYEYELEKVEIY